MSNTVDRLYDLLPVVHRMRDAEQGYPLRALLRIAGEQVNAVENNIKQLYDNWFIETCEDWVVPYISELIGYHPVAEAGRVEHFSSPLARILTPRSEAANTLAYRRRKGSLALLELLANNAVSWPARAVEAYTLLVRSQNINHLKMQRTASLSLRNAQTLSHLDGPFDSAAHTVDVRSIASHRTRGFHNISNVGVYVWRLKSYHLTQTPAYCVEAVGNHCFSFSALGHDTQLFNQTKAETSQNSIADAPNLPVKITRRAAESRSHSRPFSNQVSSDYYGKSKSFVIYVKDWPTPGAPQPVPLDRIAVAELTDWKARPRKGQLAVDPERGRIVFRTGEVPRHGVVVDYNYGFSTDMGGGEYNRHLAQPLVYTKYLVSKTNTKANEFSSVQQALEKWQDDVASLPGQPDRNSADFPVWQNAHEKLLSAVIEILDSKAYIENLGISLKQGQYLQIRAANHQRPVIRLLDRIIEQDDSFTIRGEASSRFVLDGLVLAGMGLRVKGPIADIETTDGQGDLCDVVIRHCTLVPGWWLDCDCTPARPLKPSIVLADSTAHLAIENSIIGAIHVTANERRHDPVKISISNSIVDSTNPEQPALCAPNLPIAFAILDIRNSTVIGTLQTHAIALAENSIFTSTVFVGRRQIGCIRYCYIPVGSRTPRRHNCQPASTSSSIRPLFNSLRYGRPDYCQLACACPPEIKRGADDESEMGAFHDLFQPQRETILRARLNEFTAADMQADIIFVS
jgi:hypothetical protein